MSGLLVAVRVARRRNVRREDRRDRLLLDANSSNAPSERYCLPNRESGELYALPQCFVSQKVHLYVFSIGDSGRSGYGC